MNRTGHANTDLRTGPRDTLSSLPVAWFYKVLSWGWGVSVSVKDLFGANTSSDWRDVFHIEGIISSGDKVWVSRWKQEGREPKEVGWEGGAMSPREPSRRSSNSSGLMKRVHEGSSCRPLRAA